MTRLVAVARYLAFELLDNALLVAGTALLAIGTSYIHPAGPWLVTGAACSIAGVALALPAGRR